MAGFLETTVKDIDDRIAELKAEVSRLEAARTALVGGGRAPGRTAAASTGTRSRRRNGAASSARRAGGPRGRRGGNTRANQALELVRARPGITIPQIAESLGIEPNYLYRVMPKLVESGQVTREGQGWHAAANAS